MKIITNHLGYDIMGFKGNFRDPLDVAPDFQLLLAEDGRLLLGAQSAGKVPHWRDWHFYELFSEVQTPD